MPGHARGLNLYKKRLTHKAEAMLYEYRPKRRSGMRTAKHALIRFANEDCKAWGVEWVY
jgi:hypothetical protein